METVSDSLTAVKTSVVFAALLKEERKERRMIDESLIS